MRGSEHEDLAPDRQSGALAYGRGWALVAYYPHRERRDDALKGAFDIALAAGLLLLFSPLILLLAALVRLTSRGPAFIAQERVGRGGTVFRMLKLRSMVTDAADREAELAARSDNGRFVKLEWDPRVTPLGRWLRRYSLDELPQLWNVVRGDMSLVGPRPMLITELERHPELAVHARFRVKPGMTGLWQVSGRNHCSDEERLRLDERYVVQRCLRLDLEILARTPGAVVSGDGAW